MPFFQANVDGADYVATNPGTSTGVSILYPFEGARFQVGDFVDVYSKIGNPSGVTAAILAANSQALRRDQLVSPVAGGRLYQPWVPKAPGTYELQVILETSAGGQHISKPISVIVEGEATPQTEAPLPLTGTPTETLTPTSTSTPDKAKVTADQNVNCRKGPSTAYNDVGALLQGQTAPITGRNQENSWYYIDLNGSQCWVWSGAVVATGNVNGQPLVAAPPLPITVTPSSTSPPPAPVYSACHDYPDFGTCNSDPMNFGGCSWDTGQSSCKP